MVAMTLATIPFAAMPVRVSLVVWVPFGADRGLGIAGGETVAS